MGSYAKRSLPALMALVALLAFTCVGATEAGPLGAGLAGASSPRSSSTTPGAFYVDCQAPDGGDGSSSAPWNTLAEASAATLAPGQQLLFARGSECSGSLEISSSGLPNDRIVVGAYGSGSLPLIEGTSADAVLIYNASHVTVEDLEITNEGVPDTQRRGVHLVADGTTVRGDILQDLYIHDVDGNLDKDTEGSGGIQLDALGTSPNGRFDNVQILDNQIDNVSRSGIFIVGTQKDTRPIATEAWPAGSTGIVVQGNSLDHLAGDGIVATGTEGAVLEDNFVSDGNQAGTAYTSSDAICDAGIWAWDADNTLIQYNEVTDMEFNGCDGTGYDIDYNQDGTIVQYNLSLDNAGGFILFCTYSGDRRGIVRYNLSIGDASTFNEAPCDFDSGIVGTLSGIRMYNNTFVQPKPQATLELSPYTSNLANPGRFVFENNIVDATTPQSSELPCGYHCSNNLFYGLPPSGVNAIVGNPEFTDPTGTGSDPTQIADGFTLQAGSPAIDAGLAVRKGATQDFFGDPVPSGVAPTIGFYQFPS